MYDGWYCRYYQTVLTEPQQQSNLLNFITFLHDSGRHFCGIRPNMYWQIPELSTMKISIQKRLNTITLQISKL